MLIFLDTEFCSFEEPLTLISIGMSAQDDREFYAELPVDRSKCSEFVRDVVLPQLGKIPGAQCTPEELKVRLLKFLEHYKNDEQPTVIAYDFDGDWDLFCTAIGEVPSWISGVNICRYINDLKKEVYFMENKHLPIGDHHALNDAKANQFAFVLERVTMLGGPPELDTPYSN